MSGGGSFRGRGFGPHGHRYQGPGPNLSRGSGSRSGSGSRQSGPGNSRSDSPGPRPTGPNLRVDGQNPRLGGPNFNSRGGGPPRGPCPNFNPTRHPPRHQSHPSDNWSPRGGSPHFTPWRGGRPTRFNGPPRPFYRGRGQGQYMPRFPYMPAGNFPPPFMPYSPLPERKPVELKPAVPHLGSEEERQQKITEAADALKRKLSAVSKEPDDWRDDDDETLAELSQDADHDSRITNKGIPELKHDPPELNLTVGDLRDIGRVDHDRTEQKTNPEISEDFTCDENEVEILAHNPARPMIEIDLWSDDNYGEYGEDEGGNGTTEETGVSREAQDSLQNTQRDEFSAAYGFPAFNDDCTSFANDIVLNEYGQEPKSNEHDEAATLTVIPSINAECVTEKAQAKENRSDECDKVHESTAVDSGADKTGVENIKAKGVQRGEIRTTNDSASGETTQVRDNLNKSNINKTITESQVKSVNAEEENNFRKLGEGWMAKRSNSQETNTRIPGLDSLYTEEAIKEANEEADRKKVETAVIESKIERYIIGDSPSEVKIVGKETKDSRKKVTSENVDKTLINRSEVCNKSGNRVGNESGGRKDDASRETRYVTSNASTDGKQDRAFSGFGDKAKSETPNTITPRSHDAAPRERHDKAEKKMDNTSSESLIQKNKQENRERSIDSQNKIEKADTSRFEKRTKGESGKKTDTRDKTEASTKIVALKEKYEVEKSTEVSSKQEETDRTIREGRKFVNKMPATSLSDVPVKFDPREPPPFAINYGISTSNRHYAVPPNFDPKQPPPMRIASQDTAKSPQIPPAFDPRLSAHDRNALLPTGPSITSANSVAQDFGINQRYPPQTITNFSPIVPGINYGPAPMIQPLPMSTQPLLTMPSVPVAAPIADNLLHLPPMPADPPPPLPPPVKTNLVMDPGLEEMQNAMNFANQFMNMREGPGIVDEANSIYSDFFHMPTFPDLPPPPPLLDIPTPPEVGNDSGSRQTLTNKEHKKNKSVKLESHGHQPEKLRKNVNSSNETAEDGVNVSDEIRPKVAFNLSAKTKVIRKDNEWQQQQHRDEAAEAAASAMSTLPGLELGKLQKNKSPSSPVAALTLMEKLRVANGQEDRKQLRNIAETSDGNNSKFNGNNSQTKKPETQSHSRSRSPSPARTKHARTEDPPIGDSERSEILSRRATKESSSKKSTDDTPESSWKNRVIGRFLKMSPNDICNMLNNSGLRKFDIAMKHLVKERRSSLSLGMRNNEEEKLKDPEASYNREEFMDQLNAMLDPSATVDVCNLPTQFLHHLSEVLQLDSMADFGAPLTPSDHVETTASTPPRQTARQTPRLPKENSDAKEIDDRRQPKRERENKSMSASSAMDRSVATTPTTITTAVEARKASRPCEESVESKCAVKEENIVEEVQKNPATNVHRQRRRHHRSTIQDQPETSMMNGSTSQGYHSSLNMADLDDIFSPGIARAKKQTIGSKNDKIVGDFDNDVNSGYRGNERYAAGAKDPSADRAERTAVEIDKIFNASIARAKLESKKAAAADAKAAEADDGDDDEYDSGWKHSDGKSNLHDYRTKHRSFSRHTARCEKWNRRKEREDPDAFRNLTKEEWEAKYSENSDSTYERDYRAMVAMSERRAERRADFSPTNYREDREGYEEEVSGGIMSRLGNIVTGEPGLNEVWNESEEDRRAKNSFENADFPIEAYNRSSEDGSSSSSSSGSSSGSSREGDAGTPSVTKLLKVIKAREKIGKKRSVNEEIRDEVTAELERKRRDRGRVSRKGHKSRTKKGHRRKKDKKVKVRERKKRDRKRKKRKSRRSGSAEEDSSDIVNSEDETSSSTLREKQQHLLTEREIKREHDIVIVVKNEPENKIEQPVAAKERSKSAHTTRAIEDSRSPSTSSASSMPATAAVSPSISSSASHTKTKAQLKLLPGLLNTNVESPKESTKKQEIPFEGNPKENAIKVVASPIFEAPTAVREPAVSLHSINTTSASPAVQNHPATITSDETPLSSKTNSRKLDFNTYKERTRLRQLRENEKIRFIDENPSSLTQDLLNIPLTRKKVVEKAEEVAQNFEKCKDPRLEGNAELQSTQIGNAAVCDATNKIATSTTADKTSTITTSTATAPKVSTTAETSTISTTTDKNSAVSTTIAKTSEIITSTSKTPTIDTTTAEISTVSTECGLTTVDPSTISASESPAAQKPSSAKLPANKLIRRKSLTKTDTSTTLTDARVEAGKFAHIKSEGSKELKLREKIKKGGRQRVSSEGLETTIPSVSPQRVKKRPSITLAANPEESEILLAEKKIEEPNVKRKFDYFKKGVVSDGLPDIVPQESIPVFSKVPNISEGLEEESELDSISLPITEFSSWPLESSIILTSIPDEIYSDDSPPPFKGFPKEPILRVDRVLTEADLNSETDVSDEVSFESGADAAPMSTVVDLNNLSSTGIPLVEDFVEGRGDIDTTLLGFANDIPDDPEAIAALGDDEILARNVETSVEKFPEESRESLDIIPRVTSTLNDSPAPVDFLIADVQRREIIPSPLLVTESIRENNEESVVTDLSNIQEQKKIVNTSCDDVAEVSSSHQPHNSTGNAYHEATDIDTSSSHITSGAEDKETGFRTEINKVHAETAENASEAQEVQEKQSILEYKSATDSQLRNSTLGTIHTPPPQPTSSSDSTEARGKEIAIEKQRDASETRDSERKSKESSHRARSKSREHSHGRSKKKSRRHNHDQKRKKKGAITEKMVEEAVAADIVKLVPKPMSKETVMARMVEIDLEIHKLATEKMTLYKMLQSGEFPSKDDGAEATSAKANEPRTTSEAEETKKIVPPNVLASRLVENLDKSVLSTPPVIPNESAKKSDDKKIETEHEGRKTKRKRSPQREGKSRTKDNASAENRRRRNISETKASTRATSEESSRHESTSTHSREKSTSSTELEDAEEKGHKRKTKSLQRRSPNRRSSKRSHEHSSKEDVREGSRESTDRSAKSAKHETRNLLEESTKSKLKKKTKNLEAKKSEETTKARMEEKKLSAVAKSTEKTGAKKAIGASERGIIYSDESTLDSVDPEANQNEEHGAKKDGGTSTGLALLEESFKREIAETRKFKAMEKRKGKKQNLRRILLGNTAITHDEEGDSKKESHVKGKVLKHVNTVIEAVAKNRIEQLYDETSSEARDSNSGSSPIRDCIEEKVEEKAREKVKGGTKFDENNKNHTEKQHAEEPKISHAKDSEAISEAGEEERTDVEETTKVSDDKDAKDHDSAPVVIKTTSSNQNLRKMQEDDISRVENTKKSSGIDSIVEKSAEKAEDDISGEKSGKQTLVNIPDNEKEEHRKETKENRDESVSVKKKETVDKRIEDSRFTSPDVLSKASKQTEKAEEKRETKKEPKDPIFVQESFEESMDRVSRERRNSRESDTERARSKIRNGRAGKQRNVVLRDTHSKEKKPNDTEKQNSSKVDERKGNTEKSSRPRSATKRKQGEKSAPPNRRSFRYSEDSGKTSRSKKRGMSSSRETSPYDNEPSRKKANHSRRSSSPPAQVAPKDHPTKRRARKRKRRPEKSLEEMRSCKVIVIDCKYNYLDPSMPPKELKKLGISKINLCTRSTRVEEIDESPKISRVETSSPPFRSKVDVSKNPLDELSSSPKERSSSPMQEILSPKETEKPLRERSSSPKDRSSSPTEELLPPKERSSSPKERSSSPKEHPSSSNERLSSSKERSPSPAQRSLSPKEPSPAPQERSSSPMESPPSPKRPSPSPAEIGNRVNVDRDDDEDDDVDDAFDENIQIVKASDENLPLTSQSEDDDEVVDVVESVEGVGDIIEDVVGVVDDMEEMEDVDVEDASNAVEEPAEAPDSTADDIIADDENEDNSKEENIQEADTTDEVEVLEENITIDDKTIEVQELPESEPEEDDAEPRRTRYTVHKRPILDIKVLDDSFLAASEDGAIYRYSHKSNGILNIYKGHEAAVTCIYVLEIEKSWKLYSGSLDGTFRCYDITTGLQERPSADVGSPVQCMDQAWGTFFVGTKSGHISRYHIKSGSIRGDRLEFSDKSVLALKTSSEGPRRVLIVASRSQPITIRDALTGLFLRTICGYKNYTVYSLMRERNLVYCGTSSTSIPVFDFTNGEQITQYNAGVGIVCMRLYRQILFAGCYDGNIYVFDTKETKLICSIPGPGNMLLSVEIVGDEIIAGSKNCQLHSWRMPRQVRTLLSERT